VHHHDEAAVAAGVAQDGPGGRWRLPGRQECGEGPEPAERALLRQTFKVMGGVRRHLLAVAERMELAGWELTADELRVQAGDLDRVMREVAG
jgi:hypothetical protein